MKSEDFLFHLDSLRGVILRSLLFFLACFVFGYALSDKIIHILSQPFLQSKVLRPILVYTSLAEGFTGHINIAIRCALYFTIAFLAIEVYFFTSKGMHKYEKYAVIATVFGSICLFILGCCIAYFYILPLAIDFFVSYSNISPDFQVFLQPRLVDYVDMVCDIMLAFGIAMQVPIFIFLLHVLGIIQGYKVAQYRKYIIVSIFVLAAVVTPPDVTSQVVLAGIMITMVETTLLICKIYDLLKSRRRVRTK